MRVIAIICLAAFCSAQELPVAPQRERGGRGSTREFLGLGAAPDPVAAGRGEKVYTANCGICHGPKAGGGTGPNLVRSELVLHDDKGDQIASMLLKGSPDKGMPAFPNLSKEQVSDIAQFLHLRVEQIANRGIYQRLPVVTGDAKKGEAYFNGAGRCNTCHSATGDLAHIATKFRQPDQLQSRFLYPGAGGPGGGGRGGSVPRNARVTDSNGQQFSGAIKRIDDFTISIVDATGVYHSWDRGQVKVEVADPLAAHRELAAQYSDADMHNLTAYLVTLK